MFIMWIFRASYESCGSSLAIIVGAAGFIQSAYSFLPLLRPLSCFLFLVMVLKKNRCMGLFIYPVFGVIYLGIGFGSFGISLVEGMNFSAWEYYRDTGAFLISFVLLAHGRVGFFLKCTFAGKGLKRAGWRLIISLRIKRWRNYSAAWPERLFFVWF